MKIVSAAVIGLLAAAILAPASAGAAEKGAGFKASQSEEFSASKRYRRAYWPAYVAPDYRPYHYIAPSHDFIGGPDGYPGEYAVRKSYGQCVLDLGYGRWRAC